MAVISRQRGSGLSVWFLFIGAWATVGAIFAAAGFWLEANERAFVRNGAAVILSPASTTFQQAGQVAIR